MLRSNDVLSTDEESSGGESDDELGRDLETLLRGSKTTSQVQGTECRVQGSGHMYLFRLEAKLWLFSILNLNSTYKIDVVIFV